jgi:hypothetical protein
LHRNAGDRAGHIGVAVVVIIDDVDRRRVSRHLAVLAGKLTDSWSLVWSYSLVVRGDS